MLILSEFAPQLGRPYVDTVKDSTFQGTGFWLPHPPLLFAESYRLLRAIRMAVER